MADAVIPRLEQSELRFRARMILSDVRAVVGSVILAI